MKLFGWLAAAVFALTACPQALVCYRQGHARGFSLMTLWLWEIGEWLLLLHGIFGLGIDWPMIMNALISMVAVGIILKYTYYPRKQDV